LTTLPFRDKDGKKLVEAKKSEMITSQEFFEDTAEKNKQTFKNAIDLFNNRDIRRRGQIEFIRVRAANVLFYIISTKISSS